MGFLPEWLALIVGDKKFDDTVDRIVRMIEPGALQAVTTGGSGMSVFEARGYIRSRSGLMISRHVKAEMHAGMASKHRRRLSDAVRERLTEILIPQLQVADRETFAPVRRAA